MHSAVAVDFQKNKSRHLTQLNIIACKLDIQRYKNIITDTEDIYSQKNLKKVYKSVCKVYPLNNVNFFICGKDIYLFQESKDFYYDLSVLELIREML